MKSHPCAFYALLILLQRDDFLRAVRHDSAARIFSPESSRIFLPRSTLVPSRRTTSGGQTDLFCRFNNAVRNDVAFHDAAENIDKDPFDVFDRTK